MILYGWPIHHLVKPVAVFLQQSVDFRLDIRGDVLANRYQRPSLHGEDPEFESQRAHQTFYRLLMLIFQDC